MSVPVAILWFLFKYELSSSSRHLFYDQIGEYLCICTMSSGGNSGIVFLLFCFNIHFKGPRIGPGVKKGNLFVSRNFEDLIPFLKWKLVPSYWGFSEERHDKFSKAIPTSKPRVVKLGSISQSFSLTQCNCPHGWHPCDTFPGEIIQLVNSKAHWRAGPWGQAELLLFYYHSITSWLCDLEQIIWLS